MRKAIPILCVVAVWIALGLLGGCRQTEETEDPFFQKWRMMSEQSQGHSPSYRERELDIQEPIEQAPEIIGDVEEVQENLPTRLISITMRDADIRAVIQSLAKHVNQSVMISPNVAGTVTVQINSKPWDQVFKGILRTNGLTYAVDGDIIRVMTLEDLNTDISLAQALEAQRQHNYDALQSEPLLTSVVEIEYGDAVTLQETLQAYLQAGMDVDEEGTIRSSVQADADNNALILQAVRSDMEKLFRLIDKLDRPRAQVKIQAFIVEMTDGLARDLGVQWGGTYSYQQPYDEDKHYFSAGGSNDGTMNEPQGAIGGSSPNTAISGSGNSGQGFISNFPALITSTTGGMALNYMFGTIGADILEVQLTALENDDKVKILSSPSITTLDNQPASMSNGQEIPFVTLDDSGETKIEFKEAVLKLDIEPHIIDGEYIRMHISVQNDSLGEQVNNNYIINTSTTDTTLICRNNETVIISGLTLRTERSGESGVPALMDVPMLGWLFKRQYGDTENREVLIFITPSILGEWRPGEVQMSLEEIEAEIEAERMRLEEEQGGEPNPEQTDEIMPLDN
ncbi:MAG: type IV pilus secretin PilQ [Desulfovibrio sp.]|nr:MAG: type IV pilus secretin PilQ [Desulfovibrio sp.]